MNIYLIGVAASMIVYLAVGMFAGRKVKDVNDYYVAGRNAPTILIVGSLVASFLSTAAFLGDTGEAYSGIFIAMVIGGIMQSTGYMFGAPLFGRYISRGEALTLPEYYGKRFCDPKMQKLAGITTIVAVIAYMLSAIQGISTLMNAITGLNYSLCVIIAWTSFAVFTIWSGSSGVLITDTMMFLVFLLAALIGIPFVIKAAGGWFPAIAELATQTTRPGIISAGGNLDYLYPTAAGNLTWAITYGAIWMIVGAVSPWQTSRYLMAKDEKTVLKSAFFSSTTSMIIVTLLYFTAVFVYKINPDLVPSQSITWAAMNIMPKLVGVILLTGILAAGISSASTFLSLCGFSLTNDILKLDKNTDVKKQLKISRYGMIVVSLVVLVLAYFNPPQIFWITFFGGSVVASSWAVVSFGSIWSKKLSSFGAFCSMLLGFVVCVTVKGYSVVKGVTLPPLLDSFVLGLAASVIGAVVGTKLKPKTEAEQKEQDKLFVKTGESVAGMRKYGFVYLGFAVMLTILLLVFYAIPYTNAVK